MRTKSTSQTQNHFGLDRVRVDREGVDREGRIPVKGNERGEGDTSQIRNEKIFTKSDRITTWEEKKRGI